MDIRGRRPIMFNNINILAHDKPRGETEDETNTCIQQAEIDTLNGISAV